MAQSKLHAQPLLFNQQQTQKLNQYLLYLSNRLSSPLVMLSDISGRLILCRGKLPEAQSTGLAALSAGSFAASAEISKYLNLQSGFEQQLLEGSMANLYTLKVGTELLLTIAFTTQTTLGMVRIIAQQTRAKMMPYIISATNAREQAPPAHLLIEPGFDKILKEQLDNLLAGDLPSA